MAPVIEMASLAFFESSVSFQEKTKIFSKLVLKFEENNFTLYMNMAAIWNSLKITLACTNYKKKNKVYE